MSDECNHPAILSVFASRRTADRTKAIRDAYLDVHADQLLAQMLDESTDVAFAKVFIAAQMGDLTGDAGDDALRRASAVSGPGTRDLRCASLLALAKRLGPVATPDLLEGLASTDGAVKDYAVIGLAGAGGGDAESWNQVLGYLRAVLRRKRRARGKSEVALAIAYLAQHVADQGRRSELVAFIRRHWEAIDEAEWFAQFWPDASPDGRSVEAVAVPSRAAIQEWARDPLFRPLGVPSA